VNLQARMDSEASPPPAAGGGGTRCPSRRRWISGALLVLFLAVLVGVLGLIGWVEVWARRPFGEAHVVAVAVVPGSSLREIAEALETRAVVSRAELLMVYALVRRRHGRLQAGHYRFRLPVSPSAALSQLEHGSFARKLTIPEGWTGARIARRLVEEGWIADEETWLSLLRAPRSVDPPGLDLPDGAEGFCFPDTYALEPGMTPEAILGRMLGRFAQVWEGLGPDRRDRRSEALTPREIVTLASMIEREARRPDELPLMASVYLNRLKIGMKLQCCATVHFALGDAWDRPLTRADLELDSPYNTYRHGGLPPGPISNPGRAALEAALRPAETDDLFYVYRGDGTHEFTRTYQEHLRAARRFRNADPTAQWVRQEVAP